MEEFEESRIIFKDTISSRWVKGIPMIVFLTHLDIFARRGQNAIKSGQPQLQSKFWSPDFSDGIAKAAESVAMELLREAQPPEGETLPAIHIFCLNALDSKVTIPILRRMISFLGNAKTDPGEKMIPCKTLMDGKANFYLRGIGCNKLLFAGQTVPSLVSICLEVVIFLPEDSWHILPESLREELCGS